MTRYLMVTWDGAGNLVSTLGIARTLVADGHDVRMLGHASIQDRCGDQGARFTAFTPAADWDPLEVPTTFEEEMDMIRGRLSFNPAIADDVLEELDREPADVLVVDCMLFTALSAAEASGLPTATLVHTPYTIFRGGPLVEMFDGRSRTAQPAPRQPRPGAGGRAHRAARRLRARAGRAAEGVRAGVSGRVERVPDGSGPRRARHCSAPTRSSTSGTARRPLVLVSLSTAEQDQLGLLQSIADAVAGMPVRAIVTTGPAIEPAAISRGREHPGASSTSRTARSCPRHRS